jgi:hypothetical protein
VIFADVVKPGTGVRLIICLQCNSRRGCCLRLP